jgi:hypothetical protein
MLFFKYKSKKKDYGFHKRMLRMKRKEILPDVDTAGLERAGLKNDMIVKSPITKSTHTKWSKRK